MNKSYDILFIMPLPPPVHGSTMMCQYIKESKLINTNFGCDYVNISASRNITEVHKFKFVKIWRFIKAFLSILYKLQTNNYNLCYVAPAFHKGLIKDALFVFVCKLFHQRIVLHLHGKGASEDAEKFYYRWLLEVVFKNAKVIMLSWLLYPDVEKFVNKQDVMICPNGIPFKEISIKRDRPENPVPRLLFLSNLLKSKGVFVLLDALRILKEQNYSFICDFVGGETEEINAKRFNNEVKKRGLNKLAIYQGRKYDEDKEIAFELSDVFVFPTENDTFGLVNLEAMAHKKPIITTNEGGIPDVVKDGENGFIVESKNPQALATCIAQMLDDKELRQKMGENGYQKLIKNFTIEKFENNLNSIFANFISN